MQIKRIINGKELLIRKASGDEEPYNPAKLVKSLVYAGASRDMIHAIVKDLEKWIYPGVTSKKIYQHAFSMLRKTEKPAAAKYNLKQAIYDLGPTGYPFEVLIGELFRCQQYAVEVGIVVQGHCITHEMDVIATNEHTQHLVECKYHKDQGKHVSVQVPLYVRSRVNDIIEVRKVDPTLINHKFEGWVVTNTRFSSDSIQYGTGSGLNLLAWDYPISAGLKELVEKYRIYPVSLLTRLTKAEKSALITRNIVTCRQLANNFSILNTLSSVKTKMKSIEKEVAGLLN